MAQLAWPDDLGKSIIKWDLNLMGADNWDPDRDPQLTPAAELIVQFHPEVEQAVRYEGIEGNKTIMPMISKGIIDGQGNLCTMAEDGTAGEIGVVLPATDSETITPRDWTYRAVVVENRVKVDEFPFHAVSGAEVDLAKVAPIDRDAGTAIIVETETADRAEAAAQNALQYRNTAKAYRDTAGTHAATATGAATAAEAARDETLTHGITVDNSVGTRVFVGDTLIHGDTGWRTLYDGVMQDQFDGRIDVRRIGDIVYMWLYNLSIPEGTGQHKILNSGDLPEGFVGSSSRRQQGFISGRSDPGSAHFISVYGSVLWTGQNISSGFTRDRPSGDIVGLITYWTDDAWPTELP